MTQLLSLPDDALLAVLRYLTVKEIISCRQVSRRFRHLSLHRELWKRVQVRDANLLRAAMTLAPCVGEISAIIPIETLAPLAIDTACVVAKLGLDVYIERDAVLATGVLRRLAAVGGVKKLCLDFAGDIPVPTLAGLLQAACGIGGLQELELVNIECHEPLPVARLDPEVRPSLTKLIYYSESSVEPLLQLLLQTHAATLQDVGLYVNDSAVSMLARLPRLRFLSCEPHDDLLQLLGLPISTIKLFHLGVFPPGALDFLRRASHLRVVSLNCSNAGPLLALCESRSARFVEALELNNVSKFDGQVAAALSQFPSLETLTLDEVPSVDFLQAVSPTSTPSLRTLAVPPSEDTCPHAWLHEPAVQDVLLRNPRLHLKLRGFSLTVPEDCSCPWCSWGCHRGLRGRQSRFLLFSSHIRNAGCPIECFQVATSTCSSCGSLNPAK